MSLCWEIGSLLWIIGRGSDINKEIKGFRPLHYHIKYFVDEKLVDPSFYLLYTVN